MRARCSSLEKNWRSSALSLSLSFSRSAWSIVKSEEDILAGGWVVLGEVCVLAGCGRLSVRLDQASKRAMAVWNFLAELRLNRGQGRPKDPVGGVVANEV